MTNEEAAKLIDNFLDGDEFDALRHDEIKAMELAILVLKDERPQGEWITTRTMIHDGNPYCSICDEENIIRSNFCPNCGADMRGKEDE